MYWGPLTPAETSSVWRKVDVNGRNPDLWSTVDWFGDLLGHSVSAAVAGRICRGHLAVVHWMAGSCHPFVASLAATAPG